MGWHWVLRHCGIIITGNFSSRSLIISKEALAEQTIMPAQNRERDIAFTQSFFHC